MTFVAPFLLGVGFNVALLVGFVFLVATPLGWFARSTVWAALGPEVPDRGFLWPLALGAFFAYVAVMAALDPLLRDDDPTAGRQVLRQRANPSSCSS